MSVTLIFSCTLMKINTLNVSQMSITSKILVVSFRSLTCFRFQIDSGCYFYLPNYHHKLHRQLAYNASENTKPFVLNY